MRCPRMSKTKGMTLWVLGEGGSGRACPDGSRMGPRRACQGPGIPSAQTRVREGGGCRGAL